MEKSNIILINTREIIEFWFSNEVIDLWFAKDTKFDSLIKDKFYNIYRRLLKTKIDIKKITAEEFLALIILYDQFPRNIFRNTPQAFHTDNKALHLTKTAIIAGVDKDLSSDEYKQFLYMPLMHSENIEDQELSLLLFKDQPKAFQFAMMHYDIIKAFGRFPHRNKILGRVSTKEELKFLTKAGSLF